MVAVVPANQFITVPLCYTVGRIFEDYSIGKSGVDIKGTCWINLLSCGEKEKYYRWMNFTGSLMKELKTQSQLTVIN